jgi:uroporphyrinogen-III synthase
VLPEHAAVQWQALCRLGVPDCVILTSPDALRNWQLVAGSAGLRPAWLVVSPRLQAQAAAAGARAILADGAGTAVIVSALAAAAPHIRHLRQ